MRRNKTKKTKLIAILLTLVLLISVGYAGFSAELGITGNVTVNPPDFSVHFDDKSIKVKRGSVETESTPSISRDSENGTETLTWSVKLSAPGDYYEFYVDVVNDGVIDAMISEDYIEGSYMECLSSSERTYLEYTIKYAYDAELKNKDLLEAGKRATIKIKVAFKNLEEIDDYGEIPEDETRLDLRWEANYVPAKGAKAPTVPEYDSGEPVDYSVTFGGVVLDDWRVFYADSTNTYLILNDCLPMEALKELGDSDLSMGVPTDCSTCGKYGYEYNNDNYTNKTSADAARTTFINNISDKTKWKGLLNGTLKGSSLSQYETDDAWAMGSPSLELFVNSWNAKHTEDKIYTNKNAADEYSLSSEEEGDYTSEWSATGSGMSDGLYFPVVRGGHPEYWISTASISNNQKYGQVYVASMAEIYGDVDDTLHGVGLRPVICLPTELFNN